MSQSPRRSAAPSARDAEPVIRELERLLPDLSADALSTLLKVARALAAEQARLAEEEAEAADIAAFDRAKADPGGAQIPLAQVIADFEQLHQ
jgi:hypothetical protein